jgi:hypothetical protein
LFLKSNSAATVDSLIVLQSRQECRLAAASLGRNELHPIDD